MLPETSAELEAVIDTTLLRRLQQTEIELLLPFLFSRVHVPSRVAEEVAESPAAEWLAGVLSSGSDFYRLCPDGDPVVDEIMATAKIDPGEAGVIAQAEFHQSRGRVAVAIVDEAAGYNVASLQGLRVIRTGGVLLELKRRQVIDAVAPYLDKLKRTGFHLGAAVRAEILARAGET